MIDRKPAKGLRRCQYLLCWCEIHTVGCDAGDEWKGARSCCIGPMKIRGKGFGREEEVHSTGMGLRKTVVLRNFI